VSWNLTVKTPPTQEPIGLQEAKDHLRVGIADDDQVIQLMIEAARAKLEFTYNRAFITQSLVLGLDRFVQPGTPTPAYGYPLVGMYNWGPGGVSPWGWMQPSWSVINLRPPVQSITSIKYTDPSGTVQTLNAANYLLDQSEPGRVFPALNKIWPVTAFIPGCISIEFIAGYTDPSVIPANIKAAIKLTLGSLYENREQTLIGTRLIAVELPEGVADLMAAYAPILVR
jgi:hypothetical protein